MTSLANGMSYKLYGWIIESHNGFQCWPKEDNKKKAPSVENKNLSNWLWLLKGDAKYFFAKISHNFVPNKKYE